MISNRIVIDTNVCLDLFVFHDPRWQRLLEALRAGTVEAVTRADCRMEWLIVLGYAHLPLDDVSRQRSMIEFDELIQCLPARPADIAVTPLPLCRDRDDQKFLELARDSDAAILLTKDKALLKLSRKIQRSGRFLILPPQAWLPSVPNLSLNQA